ncbi:unnamed protein product [Closterium sp. NIES-53]
MRLHSDRGGEFSSDLLAAFCAEHGIRQTFTLPASPQQNGVAKHRIGLVMEVARTSMIHAAAPHFLWPFAVQYAAHQLNLWPRVSLLETSPTLLWTGKVGDASQRREPVSRPVSPVSSGRRVPCQCQPAVSGPPLVVCRPSSPSPRVPLPPPPASSLSVVADPASDRFHAEHSTVTRLLATDVTDPSFESAAASALVTELVAFAANCRLDYAASLVAESTSVCPPSVGGECALGTDVLEDRQEDLECLAAAAPHLVAMQHAPEGDPDAPDIPTPRSYAQAIAGEYSSQWQTAMDAEMASWKSTGTYVDEVPPPGANIVSGMWIFRVKRPPGSPPVFKARYVARGFSQREGVDLF